MNKRGTRTSTPLSLDEYRLEAMLGSLLALTDNHERRISPPFRVLACKEVFLLTKKSNNFFVIGISIIL